MPPRFLNPKYFIILMSHGPLGIHLGIGQGYDKAVKEAKELQINCCQIFTHNPRGWQFAALKEQEVAKLVKDLKEAGVTLTTSHCNYLINLGTKDKEIRKKSLDCLKKEFEYASAFNCKYFVLHVGKYTDGTLETGVENVAKGINETKTTMKKYSDVTLLLETVAGQGTEIGRDFRTLGEIFEKLDDDLKPNVGICVDTCHIFAAGYDIRTPNKIKEAIKKMDEGFGINRIRMIHLNDSQKDLGERRDRHQHIGEGFIGSKGFEAFLNHEKIKPIPKILETPIDDKKGYKENLNTIRKLQH